MNIGCNDIEESRELLRKWISNQDKFNCHKYISPEGMDKIIRYLYGVNNIQRDMLENGRDDKEYRHLRKCSNSIHDKMMLDLEYGPDEDED